VSVTRLLLGEIAGYGGEVLNRSTRELSRCVEATPLVRHSLEPSRGSEARCDD